MDDKELADAYRMVLADAYASTSDRVWMEKRLRVLDPPKPEYPDGTIARVYFWATAKDDERLTFAEMQRGEWVYANGIGSYELRNNVTKVEPLRVLDDDKIAVQRVDANTEALRDLVTAHYGARNPDSNDSLPRLSMNARSVLTFYADALEAEARP